MQAGSTRSMATVLDKTNELLASGTEGDRLGDDLFAFVETLDSQHPLRRGLTEPAVPGDAKSRLLRSLVEGKLGEPAVDVLETAVRQRWSRGGDLADALEHASVTAHVAKADQAGELDGLEDDIFRFARIVEANEALREVLSDAQNDLRGKREVLHTLLEGKVRESTAKLLDQAVAGRRRSLGAVLATYQGIAAERRDSMIATVWVAAPISEEHKERLARALSTQSDHLVHLNVVVDPRVLGGVRVVIGDEVIDSTVETRLVQAQRRLER